MISGWISEEEIKFILEYMNTIGETGNILEVGSSFGRVFDYVIKYKPKWKYVAVDPWEYDGTRLQLDWNKPYHSPNNTGEIITKQMFETNCPFATTHQMYFEDFTTECKFDIISIGCMGNKINWDKIYSNAVSMLSSNGIIIGRDYYHYKRGTQIQDAVNKYKIINRVQGSFAFANDGK